MLMTADKSKLQIWHSGIKSCMAEEARKTSMLAMMGLRPTSFWDSAEMEHAQSGLGAYVRTTTIFNWIINSIDYKS
jgi:hypothetical protein